MVGRKHHLLELIFWPILNIVENQSFPVWLVAVVVVIVIVVIVVIVIIPALLQEILEFIQTKTDVIFMWPSEIQKIDPFFFSWPNN